MVKKVEEMTLEEMSKLLRALGLEKTPKTELKPEDENRWLRWLRHRKHVLVAPQSVESPVVIRWAASADVRLENLPDGGCQLVLSVMNVNGGLRMTEVVVNLRQTAAEVREQLTVVESPTGDYEGLQPLEDGE